MRSQAAAVRKAQRPIAKQFRKILLATDFSAASEQALHYATFLARHYDATLYLAHVVSPGVHSPVPAEMLETPVIELKEDAERQMRSLDRSKELQGISHSHLMGKGDVSAWILEAAREHNVGLLVAGTHGRTGMKRLMMGSVAEEIFRTASCPVLTVSAHAQPPKRFARILFATDFSESSRCAIPFAVSLAAEAKAELLALHVLPQATASNPDANALAQPLRQELHKMFEGYLEEGVEPHPMISYGDAAEVILREAELLAAGAIVLGVRNGFSSHGFTNIAYRVAIAAKCPVLTVRDAVAK